VWGCVSSQLLEVWGSYSCLGYDSEHASLGCPLAMMSSEKVWDLKLDSSFDFDSDSDSRSCLSSSSEQHSGFDFDFGFGCDSCFSLLQGFGFGFWTGSDKDLEEETNSCLWLLPHCPWHPCFHSHQPFEFQICHPEDLQQLLHASHSLYLSLSVHPSLSQHPSINQLPEAPPEPSRQLV